MDKSQIKILCVDDEPDILEILKYNLSNEGYDVSTAKDGQKAVEIAKGIVPNVIIMDIMMPNMDGIQACELLRSDEMFNDTLIMFLTKRSVIRAANIVIVRINSGMKNSKLWRFVI